MSLRRVLSSCSSAVVQVGLLFSNLMSADANMSRILRWEILPGLPGEGPIPKHFHFGHPTPWAEGFVTRFWNVDGSEWVGNFQGGIIGLNAVLEWAEADCVVLFARGACYFIPAGKPDRYENHGTDAMYALFDELRTLLIVAYEDGDLIAFDRSGTKRWIREGFGAFGVVLQSCELGVVVAEVEIDYEDSWRTVRISAVDGTDV